MASKQEMLFVGTGRFVVALDTQTGEERWRTKLKGGASPVVTLLLKGMHLFVGHQGRVYCLDVDTGAIVWKNGLPKAGFNAVLLAMEGSQGCSSQGAAAAEQVAADSAAASVSVVAT